MIHYRGEAENEFKMQRIRKALKSDPDLTINQLAERFGMSATHMKRVLRSLNMKPGDDSLFISHGTWRGTGALKRTIRKVRSASR